MPAGVGEAAGAPVAWVGDVFVDARTVLVGGMGVEVTIVGAELVVAGEQALKNRLNAAEPTQASTSRRKSRREILFIVTSP